MKFFIKSSILLFVFSSVLVSCSKEEADVRDAATGNYNYQQATYIIAAVGDELTEAVGTDNGTFSVSKGTKDSEIIITYDGDDIVCTNVAAASNGFTFNIPDYEDDEMIAGGIEAFELEGKEYHGFFDSKAKTLSFAIGALTENGILVSVIEGTKK